MSTEGYRQRDTSTLGLGGATAHVEADILNAYHRQKEACRQRLGQKELTNEEFLQVLLDVHALHLDLGGDDS